VYINGAVRTYFGLLNDKSVHFLTGYGIPVNSPWFKKVVPDFTTAMQ
jgi:hypothetical protein